jgi:hypothetical protein
LHINPPSPHIADFKEGRGSYKRTSIISSNAGVAGNDCGRISGQRQSTHNIIINTNTDNNNASDNNNSIDNGSHNNNGDGDDRCSSKTPSNTQSAQAFDLDLHLDVNRMDIIGNFTLDQSNKRKSFIFLQPIALPVVSGDSHITPGNASVESANTPGAITRVDFSSDLQTNTTEASNPNDVIAHQSAIFNHISVTSKNRRKSTFLLVAIAKESDVEDQNN